MIMMMQDRNSRTREKSCSLQCGVERKRGVKVWCFGQVTKKWYSCWRMKWDINSYIFYIQEIKEKKKLRSTLKFCTQKLVTLDGDDICVYMEWGRGWKPLIETSMHHHQYFIPLMDAYNKLIYGIKFVWSNLYQVSLFLILCSSPGWSLLEVHSSHLLT